MTKSYFEQKITHQSLSYKLGESGKLLDLLINDPHQGDDFKKQMKFKNVCAQLQESLIDRLELTLGLLSMSKREFIELAIIEALDKAYLIMDECGVNEFIDQHSKFKPIEVKLLGLSEEDGQLYGRVEITNAPFFIDFNDIQNLPEEGLHSGEIVTFDKQGDKWVFVGKGVIEEVKQ